MLGLLLDSPQSCSLRVWCEKYMGGFSIWDWLVNSVSASSVKAHVMKCMAIDVLFYNGCESSLGDLCMVLFELNITFACVGVLIVETCLFSTRKLPSILPASSCPTRGPHKCTLCTINITWVFVLLENQTISEVNSYNSPIPLWTWSHDTFCTRIVFDNLKETMQEKLASFKEN